MEKNQKKKERRERRKYRLLILLLLMLGTGIMLATSTYAWFTANKTVAVSTLNVNIEAKNGIQISADGTKWKSILQKTDITSAHTTYGASENQLPDTLEPVSTAGVVDANGKFPMYYGTVVTSEKPENKGEYILTATKETEKETNGATSDAKFIAFDVFFKVEQDTTVYLTPSSAVKSTDGGEADSGIKNASRVGFIVLGHTTSSDTVASIQALNDHASSTAYLWEPNYNTHTANGLANARDVYGNMATAEAGTLVPYSGIIDTIESSDDILLGNATQNGNATKFKDVTPTHKTKYGFTHYPQIFSLTAGVTKVRIYMWVEGQDVDCENYASGGNISFDLQITSSLPENAKTTE